MLYIDKNSDKPYYLQIYQQIQQAILNGELKKGTVLVGSRTLAQELGVGRNTIDNAYAQLVAEGYIESKKGVGFKVLEIEQIRPLQVKKNIKKEEICKPYGEMQFVQYDLSYGNFSSRYFPSKLWKRYMNEAFSSDVISRINYYQDKQGSLFLREQLGEYLKRTRGVRCETSQIIITGGLQHSLEIICKLLDGAKAIAIENPGYDGAYRVFENNHSRIHPISLDQQGLDIKQLKHLEDICAVYVTPSHQFPTGVTMTINRRYELLDWAEKNRSYIIEDDFDSEYRYHTSPIPSLQSIDGNGRVIYIGTFSKALSPSIRMGYLILPKALLNVYEKRYQKYQCVTSWLEQYIVARMIEEQEYERHVRKMCAQFRKKHDLLLKEIKKINNEIKISHSGAGLYFILKFPKEMTYDVLIEQAAHIGIKVYDTRRFWFNQQKEYENELFLGFSLIEIEEIPDCIERLGRAWNLTPMS